MTFQNQLVLMVQLLAFLFFANSATAKTDNEVEVQLSEFKVEVSSQAIKSGKIRFRVENQGTEAHEFVVSKKENNLLKELEEIEPFAPGTVKEMTLTLSPGNYELSCKVIEKEEGGIVDHYKKGMRIAFKVLDS